MYGGINIGHFKKFVPTKMSGHTNCQKLYQFFILFYLYIYPPDSQESDQAASKQLPRSGIGDAKIFLSG